MKQYFIFDFDSTFIQTESLEELAAIVLKDNPDKEHVLMKIKDITDRGMTGKIPFDESLRRRLQLLSANKEHIEKTKTVLKRKITQSIARNKQFFQQYKDDVYIISGGFKELIIPIVASFGIPENHVLANTFIYDKKGNIEGVDNKNPLSQANGKVKAIENLKLDGKIFVIGDGYTDLEIAKSEGLRTKNFVTFVAFTENVFRENITEKADYVVPNLDEFLYIYHLPQTISYPKSRISALLLENINQTAITSLEKQGFAVEYYERSLSHEELLKKISDVSILGIRSRTKVTKDILERAKRLLTIGAFCIGTDQIDVAIAQKKGIAVFNAPFSNTRSVVELVIGEIIMLARGIMIKNKNMHAGIWDKSAKGSFEIRGKTLGIIGYGNIGSQLSVLAESLGMKVIFYDTSEKLALGNAMKCESLKELLQQADIITVHVDGNMKNKQLIGEKEFQLMKQGVLFLNLSRGFIVDILALVKSLKNGKVAGAAIDVFPYEPERNDERFVSELQNLPNVILTPHIGGSTKEAQENIGEFVANKLIDYIDTGASSLSITLPNIQTVPVKHAHRLLHIHHNVPGILAKINGILAENKSNILAQELKTNEEIGYVVTDVDKKYNERVLRELKAIPETIKFRVLY